MIQYHVILWYVVLHDFNVASQHNISSCEHIYVYDIALWDMSQRCSFILWILFILMRTWLIWLIFTALEVHSVIGCAARVLQSIQHTTDCCGTPLSFYLLVQMFSKSHQKRQVLGDLRVYRVWSGKPLVCFAFLQCFIPTPTRWKGFICLICINV